MCLVWVSEWVTPNYHGYRWRQTPVAGAVIHTVFCEVPSEAEGSAFETEVLFILCDVSAEAKETTEYRACNTAKQKQIPGFW